MKSISVKRVLFLCIISNTPRVRAAIRRASVLVENSGVSNKTISYFFVKSLLVSINAVRLNSSDGLGGSVPAVRIVRSTNGSRFVVTSESSTRLARTSDKPCLLRKLKILCWLGCLRLASTSSVRFPSCEKELKGWRQKGLIRRLG